MSGASLIVDVRVDSQSFVHWYGCRRVADKYIQFNAQLSWFVMGDVGPGYIDDNTDSIMVIRL